MNRLNEEAKKLSLADRKRLVSRIADACGVSNETVARWFYKEIPAIHSEKVNSILDELTADEPVDIAPKSVGSGKRSLTVKVDDYSHNVKFNATSDLENALADIADEYDFQTFILKKPETGRIVSPEEILTYNIGEVEMERYFKAG